MDANSERRRPTAWQWARYSVGAKLPAELSEWVLHDTTCRTWALRQVTRSLLVISPLIVVLLVFIPGPFWIRALSALGGMVEIASRPGEGSVFTVRLPVMTSATAGQAS